MTTASVLPAVQQAAKEALKKIVQAAIADENSPLPRQERRWKSWPGSGRVYVKGSLLNLV